MREYEIATPKTSQIIETAAARQIGDKIFESEGYAHIRSIFTERSKNLDINDERNDLIINQVIDDEIDLLLQQIKTNQEFIKTRIPKTIPIASNLKNFIEKEEETLGNFSISKNKRYTNGPNFSYSGVISFALPRNHAWKGKETKNLESAKEKGISCIFVEPQSYGKYADKNIMHYHTIYACCLEIQKEVAENQKKIKKAKTLAYTEFSLDKKINEDKRREAERLIYDGLKDIAHKFDINTLALASDKTTQILYMPRILDLRSGSVWNGDYDARAINEETRIQVEYEIFKTLVRLKNLEN